jgi:hypothetical protein
VSSARTVFRRAASENRRPPASPRLPRESAPCCPAGREDERDSFVVTCGADGHEAGSSRLLSERIDKPDPRTNIDAVMALAMAVERAEHRPETVELLGWL